MKCFNCYSEFLPTLSKPLCQECGFCYYCRDFFSCVHYDAANIDQNKKQKQQEQQEPLQSQSQWKNKKKNVIQKSWDSYNDLISSITLTKAPPDLESSTAVIVIDESVRRKLGKLYISELIKKLTSLEMNCYVDIIPTGTSDNDVIKVFNSYENVPALILTSDKGLYEKLPAHSLFVKAKKGRNAVRIITEEVKHRISRL